MNCAAFSIPASEHSTITAWGEAHELDAYANILENCPEGLVACVSDSYDIYNAVAISGEARCVTKFFSAQARW